jgi:hypothetical protein
MVQSSPDFFDLSYLLRGSAIQQTGLRAIQSSEIMNRLKDFSPVIVGTLPLDLFTYMSDIDIICYFTDIAKFESVLQNPIRKKLGGVDSVIASFEHDRFQFEIVGQPVPVMQQAAYRHMVVEWSILSASDASFKSKVMELKRKGIKTEPAFAQVLGLQGDPYEALQRYYSR